MTRCVQVAVLRQVIEVPALVLGARFLPAVVPFQQRDDSPGLVPAEPGTAEAKYFPDIFTTRALCPNAHTIPRELYLPRKKGANFNELKCPFGCE